jgi:hypothetical protein
MRLRHLALPLTLVALTPAAARAQSDEDRSTARALAQEAEQALNAGDFARAADRYRRADALIHAPTLLLGYARAQLGLGKLVAAQEALARIVREGAPPGSPPVFAKAVAAAQAELATLAPRVPSTVINVIGPPSPTVTLDGAPVPNAALGVKRSVDPGKHTVKVSAAGFANAEAEFTVDEGKTETVTLELKPSADRAVAPAPVLAPAPAGAAEAASPLRPTEGGRFPWRLTGFVALGVGGAGLVLGAVTGAMAISKHDELKNACGSAPCGPAQESDRRSYYTLGTVSTIGFVAGGALAAGGGVIVLVAPRSASPSAAAIRPVVAPGYLGARGTF